MTANSENRYCMLGIIDHLSEEDKLRLAAHKAALLRGAMWDTGDVITVRFLEGAPELRSRVQKVAEEWTKGTTLSFDFIDSGEANIRIAFQQGRGSWSYLGTQCKQIKEPNPTMNFGWLTPESTDEDVRSVVLHEFGHALGLIHEHQNPLGGIKWNRDAVIKDLSGPPNNWTAEQIEGNMFKQYRPDDVIGTPVDKDSIMMYPIPAAWTLDGFSTGFNKKCSLQDKELIIAEYGK